MKNIRPFRHDDIPQVADLHVKVFGSPSIEGSRISQSDILKHYVSYFERYFLDNPWYSESVPSIVHLDDAGRVNGFLGVMLRRMIFRGEPIVMALSSQFIVDPASRATMAGIGMLKHFFNGPQDLSITDGSNTVSRKIWESLGGKTALLYSIHWKRVIRPALYAVNLIHERKSRARHLLSLRPLINLSDRFVAGQFTSRFNFVEPAGTSEELDLDSYLTCLNEFSSTCSLWPDYDRYTLQWMLDSLERKKRLGRLRKMLVRNKKGDLIGWFVYFLKPEGSSSVVQIVARKNSYGELFDHLFYDAWKNGSGSIEGRMKPAFMEPLSERFCSYQCGAPWFLTYSGNPELLVAIHEGDSLISRMEGELCLHFADGVDLP